MPRRKAESIFQAAMESFYRNHSLQELREGLKRSTEADPTYVQPHFNLALLGESDHDWDTAIKEFQIVSDLGTDVALAAKALQEIKRLQDVRDAWKTPAGKKKVEYDDSLSKARAFLQANRFGDAVAEAEKATQIDDSGFEAYCVQALALASMGRYTEASAILQKASKFTPEGKRESLQKVIEEVDTARRFNELVDTASELLTSGKYSDAALDYLAAGKLNPDRDDCRLRAALAYTLDKKWKEAEAILNQLIASKNLSVAREATTQLAALRLLQQNEASAPAMERLLQEQQKLVNEADSEARNISESLGKGSLQKQISEKPVSDALSRAQREVEERRYGAAVADYTEAVRLQPDSADAYSGRGYAYLVETGPNPQTPGEIHERQLRQAISDFTEAILLQPEFAEAYEHRGNAYRLLAEQIHYTESGPDVRSPQSAKVSSYFDKALSDDGEAIRLKPDFAEAYIERGNLFSYLQRFSEALADLNEAIRLNRDSATAWNNRAFTYLSLGQYQKALADSNEVIRLQPNGIAGYSNRAAAYEKLGHSEKAKQDWAKVEQLRMIGSSNQSTAGDKDVSSQLAVAEQNLNAVYTRIRKRLTPDQKEDLKQDEIKWIAKKDSMPAAQKLAEVQARIQALRQRYGD